MQLHVNAKINANLFWLHSPGSLTSGHHVLISSKFDLRAIGNEHYLHFIKTHAQTKYYAFLECSKSVLKLYYDFIK